MTNEFRVVLTASLVERAVPALLRVAEVVLTTGPILKTSAIFFPLCLCFLTGGCGAASPDFQTIDYNRVELGRTTREQIVAMVGEPAGKEQYELQRLTEFPLMGRWIEIGWKDPRAEMDKYEHAYSILPNSTKSMAVVYYDNRVVDYSIYDPHVFYKTRLDDSKIRRIEKEKTSETELLRLMGAPDSASLLHDDHDSREFVKQLTWSGGAGGVWILFVKLDDHNVVYDVTVDYLRGI
jgi:hypothetical protein